MVNIKWCKNQNKGIKLTEPNENLCKEYIENAENNKIFTIIFCLLNVLDNQYYLKNIKVEVDFSDLTNFILLIKKAINSLTFDKIKRIRNKIKKK